MPRPATSEDSFTIEPRAEERDSFKELAELFDASIRAPGRRTSTPTTYIVVDGREMSLPQSATELLETVAKAFAAGKELTVVPTKQELTTTQAAKHLGISRQYLAHLCDDGKIPYRMEGTHRRLALQDVLVYREQRDRERKARFRELVAKTAGAGEYDLPITWPPQE